MATYQNPNISRLLACLFPFALAGAGNCAAADWQALTPTSHYLIEVDTSSIVWNGSRAQVWVRFSPAPRSLWQRLTGTPPHTLVDTALEQVTVSCFTRSYRITGFEGLPRTSRHLGRADRVLPGSDEETVMQWLCNV